MIQHCASCGHDFDDAFRTTICPHGTFAANDGRNNFAHHPESYLSSIPVAPECSASPTAILDDIPLKPAGDRSLNLTFTDSFIPEARWRGVNRDGLWPIHDGAHVVGGCDLCAGYKLSFWKRKYPALFLDFAFAGTLGVLILAILAGLIYLAWFMPWL